MLAGLDAPAEEQQRDVGVVRVGTAVACGVAAGVPVFGDVDIPSTRTPREVAVLDTDRHRIARFTA